MKILKQADVKELIGMQFECWNCGAIVKTENEKDFVSSKLCSSSSMKFVYKWTQGTVICPVCKSNNSLNSRTETTEL